MSRYEFGFTLFWYALVFLGVPLFAFSVKVRKAIGRRDNWTCTTPGCGKSFRDGWMVDAAHHPDTHHKSHPHYNSVEGGSIKCIDCHQQQHETGTSLGRKGDDWAISKLERRDRRTWRWREKNG